MFHHYRRLIELRHENEVVVDGRFDLLLPDDKQLWAFTRTLDDRVLLVVANCSSAPATVPVGEVPDVSAAELLLGTHGTSDGPDLAPWESRVYALR